MSAYDKINSAFAKKSGRTLSQAAKDYEERSKRIEQQRREYEEELRKRKELTKEEMSGMIGGAPVNNVGSGNIAGLGVGPNGEPGVNKKKKKSVVPFKTFTRNPARIA